MLKYNIKYILYTLVLGLMVVSCDDDNDSSGLEGNNYTGNISLSEPKKGLSFFDDNEDITITYSPTKLKSDVSMTGLEVLKITSEKDADGNNVIKRTSVGNAVVSDNKATFSSAILAPFFSKDKTGDLKYEIVATLSDNSQVSRDITMPVTKAASISIEKMVYDKKQKKRVTQALSSIEFMSPDTANVVVTNISLSHKDATEVLEWKLNKKGTYATDSQALVLEKNDTLKLGGDNSVFTKYSAKVGDTIYFRYRLDNGSLKDTIISTLAVIPQSMSTSKSITFGNDNAKSYNFASASIKDSADENDVEYMQYGTIKATTKSGIQFVKVTSDEKDRTRLFSESDLTEAKMLFDAGSPSDMAKFDEKNDLFVYKVVRKDDKDIETTYYGLVTAATIADAGRDDEKLTLSHREGSLK